MKYREYVSKHVDFVGAIYVFIGFGIALILSAAFFRDRPSLCYILGVIFVGAGVIGHLIPFFVKGKDAKGTEKEKVEGIADKETLMQIWKTTIQTQMHFNEMLQKVRFIGLTIVIGVMGAAAETLRIKPAVHVNFLFLPNIHIAAIIQLFALLLWMGLIFLEIYFFGLLLGAVEYGKQIEKGCKMLEGGLTNRITLNVSKQKAKKLLIAFYTVPLVGGLWFLITLLTL